MSSRTLNLVLLTLAAISCEAAKIMYNKILKLMLLREKLVSDFAEIILGCVKNNVWLTRPSGCGGEVRGRGGAGLFK